MEKGIRGSKGEMNSMNIEKRCLGGSACSLHIDKERKILTKMINCKEQGVANGYDKLYYEVLHIKEANEHNSLFYPIVRDYYYQDDMFCVEMDFMYNGVSFSDLLLDEQIEQNYINGSLEFVLTKLFKGFYRKKDIRPDESYLQTNYLNRVSNRIAITQKMILKNRFPYERLKKAIQNGMVINGDYYPGILEYINFLSNQKKFLEEIMIKDTYESHHDLIMSNIIVDADKTLQHITDFRLIDPRGEKETGEHNRHYMYDMGKMLLGLDCFDLFRRYYNISQQNKYYFSVQNGTDVDFYTLKFNLKDTVVNHYKNAQKKWWNTLEKLEDEVGMSLEEKEIERKRFLFSFAHMYHPDIPCRMIYEDDEELALSFYARGMMVMRYFVQQVWGCDMLNLQARPVILWEKKDE